MSNNAGSYVSMIGTISSTDRDEFYKTLKYHTRSSTNLMKSSISSNHMNIQRFPSLSEQKDWILTRRLDMQHIFDYSKKQNKSGQKQRKINRPK